MQQALASPELQEKFRAQDILIAPTPGAEAKARIKSDFAEMGQGGQGDRHAGRLKARAMAMNGSTQVVMLGTGTPRPDPDRSGPATAIVVNDTPYLVDFGPGVIRRAAAAYQKGVTAFGAGVVNLATAFLTHLHSDHTMGYPDLIFTPWLMGRREPLRSMGRKASRP